MSRLNSIEGFDKYFVSEDGKVFSEKYNNRRQLKCGENHRGYLYVNLSKNGKYKSKSIHRLVASSFIPKIKGKDFVNHIDGDKKNNHVSNLEWCTQKENMQHASKNGLSKTPCSVGSKNGRSILNETQVLDIKQSLLKSEPVKSIANRYNVSIEVIKNIKYGKSWKHVVL